MKAVAALSTIALLSVSSFAVAQKRPDIRQLGPAVARSTESLGSVAAVKHLPKGGVLVNDVARRRVILFDSTLTTFSVVADSTSATASAYSGRTGGLIPYRGDSALFVDPTSMSMMVIDPTGKLGRVMSVPRSQDAMMLSSTPFGIPGFDRSGRLIYRGTTPRIMPPPRQPGVPFTMPPQPDSAAIVRIDLATRTLDTLTFIKTPKIKLDVIQIEGRVSMTSQVNPLPVVDDWAVLSDGSLAVVRGQDYHVDIFGADGKKVAAPKMAFEWQRLSDEDKVAFIDSVKAARERMLAASPHEAPVAGGGTAAAAGAPAGGLQVMIMSGGPDGANRGGGATRGGAGMSPPTMNFVQPSELPDYKPAFFAGSIRSDADGNLWVRTIPTKAIPGGPVYDVINGRGELVERVQIPVNRTVVGFGSGGIVYLSVRENHTIFLERARAR